MSFRAKDLSYNKQEPSFLRKLREEHGGVRNNVQIARPKKDRLKTGDADEDEPTMVDEHGESLGKNEWEEMLRKEREGGKDEAGGNGEVKASGKEESQDGGEKDRPREKQQMAEIGASKKRKGVRVVDEEKVADEARAESKPAITKGLESEHQPKVPKIPKKKAKKIKLSFDEPDEG
jgi:Domain of unknown function (DUF4604)